MKKHVNLIVASALCGLVLSVLAAPRAHAQGRYNSRPVMMRSAHSRHPHKSALRRQRGRRLAGRRHRNPAPALAMNTQGQQLQAIYQEMANNRMLNLWLQAQNNMAEDIQRTNREIAATATV